MKKSARWWASVPTDSLSVTWPAMMSSETEAITDRKAFSAFKNFDLLSRAEVVSVNLAILKLSVVSRAGSSFARWGTTN